MFKMLSSGVNEAVALDIIFLDTVEPTGKMAQHGGHRLHLPGGYSTGEPEVRHGGPDLLQALDSLGTYPGPAGHRP